jgi:hypothetical protein
MRTTLTIDDDLAEILHKKAGEQGHSFKSVVNDLLRAGIAAGGETPPPHTPVKVIAKPLGLKPGYDSGKFNQLADELEVEAFLEKQSAQ